MAIFRLKDASVIVKDIDLNFTHLFTSKCLFIQLCICSSFNVENCKTVVYLKLYFFRKIKSGITVRQTCLLHIGGRKQSDSFSKLHRWIRFHTNLHIRRKSAKHDATQTPFSAGLSLTQQILSVRMCEIQQKGSCKFWW